MERRGFCKSSKVSRTNKNNFINHNNLNTERSIEIHKKSKISSSIKKIKEKFNFINLSKSKKNEKLYSNQILDLYAKEIKKHNNKSSVKGKSTINISDQRNIPSIINSDSSGSAQYITQGKEFHSPIRVHKKSNPNK